MVRLPPEQERLVGECGYTGVICGIALCFLLTRGQTLVSFESLLPPLTTIKSSAFIGWLLVPLFLGTVFAAAARAIIYKFAANDALVPFARTIGAAKALAALAAVYYFAIRPTLQGKSPLLTQALVFLGVIHVLAVAGKTWGMVKDVETPK